MELIDSHVHFWPAPRLQYDWLEAEPKIAAPHGPREYQLESAAAREAGLQLRGLVFVEAGRAPAQGLAEAKWVASLAQEAPILGIVAHASLELGVAIRPSLALLAKMRGDKKESPDDERIACRRHPSQLPGGSARFRPAAVFRPRTARAGRFRLHA